MSAGLMSAGLMCGAWTPASGWPEYASTYGALAGRGDDGVGDKAIGAASRAGIGAGEGSACRIGSAVRSGAHTFAGAGVATVPVSAR